VQLITCCWEDVTEDILLYKNVKIIAGEECVSQHQLLVGDVVISSALRKKKRMHIHVWKLREPNVKQEFARLVTERKDEFCLFVCLLGV